MISTGRMGREMHGGGGSTHDEDDEPGEAEDLEGGEPLPGWLEGGGDCLVQLSNAGGVGFRERVLRLESRARGQPNAAGGRGKCQQGPR